MSAAWFSPRKWAEKNSKKLRDDGKRPEQTGSERIPSPAVTINDGTLILHGMLAGYFEQDGTAVADELFFGTELNRQLLAMGLRVRWESGIADLLGQRDAHNRSVSPQFARVYQLHPTADPLLKFAPYEAALQLGGPPVREQYRIVYDGPCPSGNLDDICDFFEASKPGSFTGHPVSISDIIELYDQHHYKFFYVDAAGYRKIEF